MAPASAYIILFLMGLSLLLFLSAVWALCNRLPRRREANRNLYLPSLLLVACVFLLRFAVGLYRADACQVDLNFWETAADSLIHMLQSFSLDEDYTGYLVDGKTFLLSAFPNSGVPAVLYGAYASIVNLCAPIAGGAILLGLLTGIFPRLRLICRPVREKYLFSELNERSVCLAEDIRAERARSGGAPPLIVFTDAYANGENEQSAELLKRAKDIGAVCLKDDILHCICRLSRKLHYILIDEMDNNNLQTFITLAGDKTVRWRKKTNVFLYLFTQDDEADSLVRRLYKRDKAAGAERRFENTVIKVVHEYTNIALNLLDELPLYTPLLSKYVQFPHETEKELAVTLIGDGKIGMACFLAAYWCGQLSHCKLTINVVSDDTARFRDRLNRLNPDLLESGEQFSPLLRIFPHRDEHAPPYAAFSFCDADVTSASFPRLLRQTKLSPSRSLLESDYFIVALGSDRLNMATALELDRNIRKMQLEKGISARPVIAFSIYDDRIKETLNALHADAPGPRLHAFAALRDFYCCRNVFMKSVSPIAACNNATYNKSVYDKAAMLDFLRDEYTWWADIAKALHLKYKLFSAGVLPAECDPAAPIAPEVWQAYYDKINRHIPGQEALIQNLTWLEHRRWNAFMRTRGFVCPTQKQLDGYYYRDGNTHKNLDLRLHPCIVESAPTFHLSDADWTRAEDGVNPALDFLDLMSVWLYRRKPNAASAEAM